MLQLGAPQHAGVKPAPTCSINLVPIHSHLHRPRLIRVTRTLTFAERRSAGRRLQFSGRFFQPTFATNPLFGRALRFPTIEFTNGDFFRNVLDDFIHQPSERMVQRVCGMYDGVPHGPSYT